MNRLPTGALLLATTIVALHSSQLMQAMYPRHPYCSGFGFRLRHSKSPKSFEVAMAQGP